MTTLTADRFYVNTRRVRAANDRPEAAGERPAVQVDFCNFGVVLRVLVGVNIVALVAAVVMAGSSRQVGARFLDIAALLEPITLLTLGAVCALRQRLSTEADLARAASAGGVGALAALLVQLLLLWAIPGTGNESGYGFGSIALVAALAAAATMHYFDLRSRAYSPAIDAARLQALQSRIRPHFLFNSFNAAISLVRKDPKRAERVLEDLSDIFRMLMRDSRSLITLEEEIELAKQYLAIEQVRLGDRLETVWDIQRLPTKHKVPPLLLQPLLENAVQHGIEPNTEPGQVRIRITGMARELVIVVENTYRPGAVVPGNGIALGNIRERLRLVFDLEAKLTAAGDGSQFRVVITLPISAAAPS
ncbi:histidine kinase [soil metagenome]